MHLFAHCRGFDNHTEILNHRRCLKKATPSEKRARKVTFLRNFGSMTAEPLLPSLVWRSARSLFVFWLLTRARSTERPQFAGFLMFGPLWPTINGYFSRRGSLTRRELWGWGVVAIIIVLAVIFGPRPARGAVPKASVMMPANNAYSRADAPKAAHSLNANVNRIEFSRN